MLNMWSMLSNRKFPLPVRKQRIKWTHLIHEQINAKSDVRIRVSIKASWGYLFLAGFATAIM
jgi:hypothetical protein